MSVHRTGEGELVMRVMRALAVLALVMAAPVSAQGDEAIERQTHGAYVDAINSNDLETFLAALTEDIVLQAPGVPELVGKAAVREWARNYLATYRTTWEKTSNGLTVSGDWAFERYTYKSTDIDKKTFATTVDTGKGVNIFRRGEDGTWRVAIDGWSSDKPAAQ